MKENIEQKIDRLQKIINKIPGDKNRFYVLQQHYLRWKQFFLNNRCKKTDQILDYGCGSGFSIFTGNIYNYNVRGLEIENEAYESVIEPVFRIIGVKEQITIYDWREDTIPFSSNSFNIILGSSSITKDKRDKKRKGRFIKRVKELVRISKENAIWYITPPKHLHHTKKIYDEVSSEKNIQFKLLEEMS